VYVDGSYHGYKTYYTTSVSWSYFDITGRKLDAGVFSQGEHTIRAVATSHNGVSVEATSTFTIDNTPKVAINSPGQVQGAFDLTGSATFKESSTSYEGRIYVYVDGSYHGYKTYYTKTVSWSYSEITGHELDAGIYSQGEHAIRAVATSRDGVSIEATSTFTIDNTPSLSAIQKLSVGTDKQYFDLHATVTFKEHVGGIEGRVYAYLNGHLQGSKIYDVKQKTVKYSEITGGVFKEIDWLMSEAVVTFKAVAYNGAWAQQDWSPAGPDDNLGNPDEEPDDEKPADPAPEPDPPACK
jgi:hypothetical protein